MRPRKRMPPIIREARKRSLKYVPVRKAISELSEVSSIARRSPEKWRALEAFLARKGMRKAFGLLENEALALAQNYNQARVDVPETFAISRKDEASFLKDLRAFSRAMQDAKRLGIV